MRSSDTNALAADIVAMLQTIIYAPATSITADTRLADLGMDSLDLVEAGLELEAIVGRHLPDGVLTSQTSTIGDLAAGFLGRAPVQQLSLAA